MSALQLNTELILAPRQGREGPKGEPVFAKKSPTGVRSAVSGISRANTISATRAAAHRALSVFRGQQQPDRSDLKERDAISTQSI